jgi:hypothetical protein
MVVLIITVWCTVKESDHFKLSYKGRSYSSHVRMRNVYKDLDRKLGRKRTLERPMCRWKDSIQDGF